jgi:hypothetical protein
MHPPIPGQGMDIGSGVTLNPGNDNSTADRLRKSLLDEDAHTSQRLVELEPLIHDLTQQFQVALKAEEWELVDQLSDHKVNLLRERRLLQSQRLDRLRTILNIEEPIAFMVEYHNSVSRELMASAQAGVEQLQRWTDLASINGKLIEVWQKPTGTPSDRSLISSHTPGTADIQLRPNAPISVVLHELGHWLEDTDPIIHQKAVAFYERRTQNDALCSLIQVTGNTHFSANELTRLDQWLQPYIGKEYVRSDGTRYATEILSVGLEMLYTKPVELATADPEMFEFVISILRGR